MKILYLFTSTGHGIGGHFYDALHIGEGITKLSNTGNEVILCNIGNHSPIIEKSSLKKCFLNNRFNVIYNLVSYIKRNNINILHAYDWVSFIYASWAGHLLNKNCIFTKCGGENSPKFFLTKNMVVVSQENFEYYYPHLENVFYIPNRIYEKKLKFLSRDEYLKEKDKLGITSNKFLLLKLGRLSKYYYRDYINLIKDLDVLAPEIKKKIKLLFITPPSNEISEFLKFIDNYSVDIAIRTEERYTIDAHKYIDIADVVISKGRGVMEALIKNKPTFLTTYFGKTFLLTKETIDIAFYSNFSGRIEKSKKNLDLINKTDIKKILPMFINGDRFYNNILKEYRELKDFKTKYIDISSAVKKYEILYNEIYRSKSFSCKVNHRLLIETIRVIVGGLKTKFLRELR